MITAEIEEHQILTVKQFAQRHTWITLAGLRWLLFRRDSNGLQKSGAILKIGRKILIDEQLFLQWLRQQGQERVNAIGGGRKSKSAKEEG